MRSKFLWVLFLFTAMTLTAQTKKYTASTAEWSVIEGRISEEYPQSTDWQLKKFDQAIIIPQYKGAVPQLQNFEIHHKGFPNMLDIAVGPPSEGIYRPDEKELTRYVEFINEKAFETDNNLEYLLPLEGQWGLDKKFRTKDFLFQFITGTENWLEVIAGNKLLASGKGKVILAGDAFPEKGNAVIKVTSIDTNNKGLIDVKIYKAYEQIVVDPFHKTLSEKWYTEEKSKNLSWEAVTEKAIKKSPWLPENTPAIYKRVYSCPSLESTQNIYFSAKENITHLWVNGKQVDINNCRIPDGYFRQGENEVLYYSTETVKGLDLNLDFLSVRPYWLKTELEGSKNSVVSAMVRGASAKVYVNGKYAGVLNKERTDEFLGYGLFKDGKNEVALCILQNNPKTFLEELYVREADENTALVLPWQSNDKELSSRAPGRLSSYDGFYLQYKAGQGTFETVFSAKPGSDLELIFDSGKRFPKWMFKESLFVPGEILLNGKSVKRTGNSFVLPAKDLQAENKIQFSYIHGQLPEPLLYLSSKAKPKGFFRSRQIGRFNREKLKPGLYFTGEKVSYLLDVDFSAFDKVSVEFDDQKFEFDDTSKTEFTIEIKKAGKHELKFTVIREGKSVQLPSKTLYAADFPANPKEWLQANKTVSEILIGSDAFYNSESTLFPEFHQREWMLRELKSDSGSIEFGPLASWKEKQKFSIFDSLPNGEPVFEKFGRRMETYMKLRSRGYPVIYAYEKKINRKELFSSAATVFQYLKWLESQNVKVDWSKETLAEFISLYVDGMKDKADKYLEFRTKSISDMIKKLALNAAPNSIFKEVAK